MDCYLTLNRFIKEKYGIKLRKIPLFTNLTCPNRDGTISYKGCYYCNNEGFNPFFKEFAKKSIREQINFWIDKYKNLKNTDFIAYYQTYTNTYAPLDVLEEMYRVPLEFDRIRVISIATRPDCFSDNILNLIKEIHYSKEVWLEIGLQSASDKVLEYINRGHSVHDFIEAIHYIRNFIPGIRISTHLIFGLPHETYDDIKKAAAIINDSRIDGVKIHPLAIVKHTVFAKYYKEGEIQLISMDEYVNRVVYFLQHLNSNVVIERISEDTDDLLIAPNWVGQKHELKRRICERLKK